MQANPFLLVATMDKTPIAAFTGGLIELDKFSQKLGKSKETLRRWDRDEKLIATREPISDYRIYKKSQIDSLIGLFDDDIEETTNNFEKPLRGEITVW